MRGALLLFAALLSGPVLRFTASPDPVVTAAWLNQHLHDRDLVIIQVSRPADYQKGHIAGTRLLDSLGLEAAAMGTGAKMDMAAFPGAAELHGKLEKLGVSDGSHVVVVYAGTEITRATRTIFLTRYAGLDNVSLLDGGLAAWQRAGLPVTQDVPVITPGHLTVALDRNLGADYAWVEAHQHAPHVRIIDARDPVYFDGPPTTGMGMAPGHIAGAHNIPFSSLVDDNGLLLSREALTAKFRNAGVQPGDTVLAYCHVGIQATMLVLGAQVVGQPVRMYLGSFHDWTAHHGPTEGGKP